MIHKNMQNPIIFDVPTGNRLKEAFLRILTKAVIEN